MFRFDIRKDESLERYSRSSGLWQRSTAEAGKCCRRSLAGITLPLQRRWSLSLEHSTYGDRISTAPAHCAPRNRDSRRGIARAWSFLVNREQHGIQGFSLCTLLHSRSCALHRASVTDREILSVGAVFCV